MIYPLPNGMVNFYTNAEPFVEKGDHIRLQYITFNYTLSKKRFAKLPMYALDLYLNANNLGIIWKANKAGIDPEYPINSSIPPSRTVSIGLKATF